MKKQKNQKRSNQIAPSKRVTEVLAMFILNNKKWLSHYDFALDLWNINSHKRIGELRDAGVKFEEKMFKFTNRFDRVSYMKKFKMTSGIRDAKKVFFKLNGENI